MFRATNPAMGNPETDMQDVCDVLEKLASEGTLMGYALGGATAAGFHGEPLATRDIDVFVFLESSGHAGPVNLQPLFSRLACLGFDTFEEEALLIHGFPVQFLAASPGLESEAVEQALVADWDNHRLRVMQPEYLAAIALTVGRPKDRARVVYLASLPQFRRDVFQDILRRYQLLETWRSWAQGLGLAP
jgi:hypothetical protein